MFLTVCNFRVLCLGRYKLRWKEARRDVRVCTVLTGGVKWWLNIFGSFYALIGFGNFMDIYKSFSFNICNCL